MKTDEKRPDAPTSDRSGKPNPRRHKKGNKRGNGNVKPRDTKDFDRECTKGSNNPSWYATNPAILRDYASYPFAWSVGTKTDLNNPIFNTASNHYLSQFVVPGFTIQYTAPSVGLSKDTTSPINIAAQQLYTEVRGANSGAKNYDPVDLMLYYMAMSSVYSAINWLQRIYGIATTTFSQENRYMPDSLLRAEGIDAQSVRDNIANFRGAINILIQKVASFPVPSTLTMFVRQAFMYKDVYHEGDSMKDQIYFYSPHSFYKYQLDENNAGMLGLVVRPYFTTGAVQTAQDVINMVQGMVDALFFEEDIGIMGGDTLKAFGQNVIKMVPLDENYNITPLFDIGVLEQMANATVLSAPGDVLDPQSLVAIHTEIRQVNDNLPGSPYLTCNNLARFQFTAGDEHHKIAHTTALQTLKESKFLTTTTKFTDPGLVIENSRLMLGMADFNSPEIGVADINLYSGTEIVVLQAYYHFHISAIGQNELTAAWSQFVTTYPYTTEEWDAALWNPRRILNMLSTREFFRFCSPIHFIPHRGGTAGEELYFLDNHLNQDVDNYTLLHNGDLDHLHQVAILNLLNVKSSL